MKIPRVYLDTSVIGGCSDAEFQEWSNLLLDDFQAQRLLPVVSTIVDSEIQKAPPLVREKYNLLLELGAEVLEPDEESDALVQVYLPAVLLSAKHSNDMQHIAMATVAKIDLLVSWNFKHIVHWDKMRIFNAINLREGYGQLQILSPREVIRYE